MESVNVAALQMSLTTRTSRSIVIETHTLPPLYFSHPYVFSCRPTGRAISPAFVVAVVPRIDARYRTAHKQAVELVDLFAATCTGGTLTGVD